MTKKLITYILLFAVAPAVVLCGSILFEDKQYAWISICLCIIGCLPFFYMFEKGRASTGRLVLIAVMVALTVAGRVLFAPIPGFKPVTALVVITAMYFGGEAGFITGAMSALLSNFYFGQGPWTPFQMFSWGIVGFIAGVAADPLKRSRIALVIYAVVSGVLYSLLMDVWTVLWADGYFNISRYIAAVISAVQFTVIYAVSNVVFLLLFAKPIGKVLERVKKKYLL